MKYKKISFVAGATKQALKAKKELESIYGSQLPEDADIIIALGGDGLMLQTLHQYINSNKPIYGMNLGSIGFLMNEFDKKNLNERISKAEIVKVNLLKMTVTDSKNNIYDELAINEVSLFRTSYQAAKLKISVDGKLRLKELICDGIMVATPAGSTAYNLSANGPILPINAKLLSLMPINAFRPRRWKGALLNINSEIDIEVIDHKHRHVSATADSREIKQAKRIKITIEKDKEIRLMFDPDYSLDERIIREQFLT
ncbi:NAD kinase [Hyphomicrobiales bacterium]|jgi:NAD+ kinase|nr:NAD kinase [Rhodobiaceae bacterium]MDB4831750.1 NAD kinase [Hyphomicrobiales bacterium]MBT5640157.1 NAD kinase [Rhodobiaceae bacterium]MBT6223481.1 NAD kinase [Rhodobiaceae bacterium]MDC0139302.1 NAD kinase [Hyphomicrobiales bacterium]|tara:strand:+ start:156 stop:923 length:768 start_codon:yes stop_codon:yes gene_type:complete